MSTEAKWLPFATGGLGSCSAAIFSHPVDTMKVRLQLAGELQAVTVVKRTGVQVAVDVIKKEGAFVLYKGLTASLARQLTYTTTRFGVYGMIKDACGDNFGSVRKVGAALGSGAIGAFVGCPCDVTLVRMQADGRLPAAQQRGYRNVLHGLVSIAKNDGISALFCGWQPLVFRGMLMTAGQVASYDMAKELVLEHKLMADGVPLHFSCSMFAGLVAAVMTSPVDVVKTRIMSASAGIYKGALDCVVKTAMSEGIGAFYKGFIPYFVRLGPHTILTFVFMEQFKILLTPFAQKPAAPKPT